MSGATCPACGAVAGAAPFCGNCGARLTIGIPVPVGRPPILPSLALTIVITIFFGIFGVIPAAVHAGQANQVGQSGARYWKAFGWTMFASVAGSVALTMLVYGSMFAALLGLGAVANVPVNTSTYGSTQQYKTTYAPTTTRTTTRPATTTYATVRPTFPATAKQCNDWVAVNANTSCEFGQNVAGAYASTAGGSVTLRQVYSPITQKYYDMTCTKYDLVTCTGGTDAAVYLR